MKECEVGEMAKRWCEAQGYTCYCEVPTKTGLVDLIALKDNAIIWIECKTRLNEQVVYQAAKGTLYTTEVYCAVGVRPKSSTLNRAIRQGLGVLCVDGDSLSVVVEPHVNKDFRPIAHYTDWILKHLEGWEPGGACGVACMKGVGPAQDVARLVKTYRETSPNASWREMHAALPNHYSNPNSMRGALVSRGLCTP